jgi:hypothetical protein
MPLSNQAISTIGGTIPGPPGSVILLLPTDAHPGLWTEDAFGQTISYPIRGGSRSQDPITGQITYNETVSVRVSSSVLLVIRDGFGTIKS